MDFDLRAEEAFRREIRSFLEAELALRPASADGSDDDAEAFRKQFVRKLGARGYLAVAWPREYGGQGWPLVRQMIFNEEMAYHRAPRPAGAGFSVSGPSIIAHGSEAQKKQHLPLIAREEVIWCQLFSEPDAGSDLANVSTRAEDKGDYFLCNGHKIWTTDAHRAQWGIMLARSNPNVPKHKGLSTLLVDMSLPGIQVHPIQTMLSGYSKKGTHNFNEVVLQDVRVPRDCLLGEKDRGWYQAITGLEAERSSLGTTTSIRKFFEELVDYVRGLDPEGQRRVRESGLAQRLAGFAVELETARMMGFAIVSKQNRHESVGRESSEVKLFVTELEQRAANLGMQVLGLYSQVEKGDARAQLYGRVERLYRISVASSIGAGTSEIVRNVIAQRGLGLPTEKLASKA